MLHARRWCLPPLLLLGWALAIGLGGATDVCSALDLPPLRSDRSPLFSADVAISLDGEGHPALVVSISVPHSELQWVRRPGGYGAGVEFTVVFQPRRGRMYGDVWARRMLVSSFRATNSPSTMVSGRRSFAVPPGRYQVRVEVSDLNAEQGSSASQSLEVPDYSRVPVGFADLELGVVDSLAGFRAVPTRRFGLDVARLAARVALFDRRPGAWPRTYPFHYRILDESGEEVVTGDQVVTLGHSAEPVLVRPGGNSLFLGTYTLEVALVEGRSRWRVDRSFEVEESGPPRGREFERMLEPLSYVAEPGEIEHLRSLPPEEQTQGWDEFWRRRDPTPETARNEAQLEFFRRVRYAEQHFQGFGPGWRSDMGRIYIKFGPPDQIENRPPTSQSPQLELWYYNQPYRRFVFADREGFGRYVLISPAIE